MVHYHVFVQSKPNTPKALAALDFVRHLDFDENKIIQVYFYYEGVFHASGEESATLWKALAPEANCLKVCQTYLEKWDLKVLPGFTPAGLVDFFAKHWQDQGKLVQF